MAQHPVFLATVELSLGAFSPVADRSACSVVAVQEVVMGKTGSWLLRFSSQNDNK
jgi:hypothetical protein